MDFNFFILKALDPATRFAFAAQVLIVVISITLHELAHGLEATRLGDPTPRREGRLTLNPLTHMGPFSILALLLLGIAWGAMPIDPARLRGRYAEAKVAFAGPSTNILLGLVSLIALGLLQRFGPIAGPDPTPWLDNLHQFLWIAGYINLVLAAFNLLPAPPLDGSHILANFYAPYARFLGDPSRQGIYILMFFFAFAVLHVLDTPLAQLAAWVIMTTHTVGM